MHVKAKTAVSLPPHGYNNMRSLNNVYIHGQGSIIHYIKVYSITYHNWEDDSQEGGFEDPEHSQTYNLDEREQVDPPQRNVAQEGEIRLVLGRHHVQLDPVPELWRMEETRWQKCERRKRFEGHELISCRPAV